MSMIIDNAALSRVFGSIRNAVTGFGTAKDKTTFNSVATVSPLTHRELSNLFRSSATIKRVVKVFPEDATAAWLSVAVGEGKPVDPLYEYINTIGDRQDRLPREPRYTIQEAFRLAAMFSRLYGNGAVLLGIADGGESADPVNESTIQSIRWCKPIPRNNITRNNINDPLVIRDPDSGLVSQWHPDRVLWFRGEEILDSDDPQARQGFDDSVIQSIFNRFSSYDQGVTAAALMITEYDQAIFSVEGLAEMMNGSDSEKQSIFDRFVSLNLGRSVARAAVLDKSLESFEYQTRNYTGVDALLNALRQEWVSVSGIPSWKLFGTSTGAGLATANTAGLAARFEWAGLVESWMHNHYVPPFERLVSLCFAARDCPISEPTTWEAVVNPTTTLSPLESMELQKFAAERDQINTQAGIYTADEAREQYAATRFTGRVALKETPPPNPEQVRSDWAAGLLDNETALELLGYPNPAQIAARLKEQVSEGYGAY